MKLELIFFDKLLIDTIISKTKLREAFKKNSKKSDIVTIRSGSKYQFSVASGITF